MYPENPEGTRVIVGSMNMGYVSDTARTLTCNLFHPQCMPIPIGHSDGFRICDSVVEELQLSKSLFTGLNPCHHAKILSKLSGLIKTHFTILHLGRQVGSRCICVTSLGQLCSLLNSGMTNELQACSCHSGHTQCTLAQSNPNLGFSD